VRADGRLAGAGVAVGRRAGVAWSAFGVGVMAVTREQVVAWVERTCADQQLPVAITDVATLKRIGVLLGRGGPPRPQDAPARPGPTAARPVGRGRE
jgi:hypothetical protein